MGPRAQFFAGFQVILVKSEFNFEAFLAAYLAPYRNFAFLADLLLVNWADFAIFPKCPLAAPKFFCLCLRRQNQHQNRNFTFEALNTSLF